jgi:CheY-like chemotaxis protein
MDLHAPAAATKHIDLRSRMDLPPSGQSWVLSDEVKLFEIINNLLSNALKFTSVGFVELTVRLTLPGDAALSDATLHIEVRESGSGISHADRDRVFVPFFQARHGDQTRALGGTGLGLSIIKQLVETLKGRIRLDSGHGRGSVFSVELPVALAPDSSAGPQTVALSSLDPSSGPVSPSHAAATGEFQGKRLLLVDDNELNAMLARRVLQAIGFEVVLAENGAIAVELFAGGRFDIVLMDCQMPVMDGYVATQRIRAHERANSLRRTPVIAITAYTLAGDREKCLTAGMDDFQGKPYSISDLRPKLAVALSARRV